jgi:hypothetical protein
VPIAGTRGPSFLDHQVIRQFLNTRGLPTRDRLDHNDYSEPAITAVKYRACCSISTRGLYQAHALQNLAPAAPLNERRPARDFLTASRNARLGQRRQKKQKPEQPSTKHANAPNKRPKELDHCEYSDETDREDTDISIKAKQLGNPSACRENQFRVGDRQIRQHNQRRVPARFTDRAHCFVAAFNEQSGRGLFRNLVGASHLCHGASTTENDGDIQDCRTGFFPSWPERPAGAASCCRVGSKFPRSNSRRTEPLQRPRCCSASDRGFVTATPSNPVAPASRFPSGICRWPRKRQERRSAKRVTLASTWGRLDERGSQDVRQRAGLCAARACARLDRRRCWARNLLRDYSEGLINEHDATLLQSCIDRCRSCRSQYASDRARPRNRRSGGVYRKPRKVTPAPVPQSFPRFAVTLE